MLARFRKRISRALKSYDRLGTRAKEWAWSTRDFRHFRRRVAVGRELGRSAAPRVSKKEGYLRFDASAFGGTAAVVAAGRAIRTRWSEKALPTTANKEYFHNLVLPTELSEKREIMSFAMNRALLGTLSEYFGFVPELCSVGLMISVPSEVPLGSQYGHFDAKDSHHVKVIVAVEDVSEENGPFEFLPADVSAAFRKKRGIRWSNGSRFGDDVLEGSIPRAAFVKMTANAGDGLIVDTSNCLHYGSRVARGFRLMWFFHYATFSEYESLEATGNGAILMAHFPDRARFAADEATRLALEVRDR